MHDSAVLSGRASFTRHLDFFNVIMNREENVLASQDESQDRQTYPDAHHHHHPQAVVLRRLEHRQRRTEVSSDAIQVLTVVNLKRDA